MDLIARLRAEAPGAQVRFLAGDEETALRDGKADVAIKVNAPKYADLRAAGLVREPLVGVVRTGHPLGRGEVTASRFTEFEHVMVSRSGRLRTTVDRWLADQGLHREIVACRLHDSTPPDRLRQPDRHSPHNPGHRPDAPGPHHLPATNGIQTPPNQPPLAPPPRERPTPPLATHPHPHPGNPMIRGRRLS